MSKQIIFNGALYPAATKVFSCYDQSLNLGVCGDWLIGGKVENAFLSGLDLYKNINDSLNNG